MYKAWPYREVTSPINIVQWMVLTQLRLMRLVSFYLCDDGPMPFVMLMYIYMQMLRCTFTFHLVLWCGRYQFIIKLCFTSTNRLKCNQKVYFRSLAFIEFIHSQFPPTVGFIFEDMLTLGAYCREILLARFFKID